MNLSKLTVIGLLVGNTQQAPTELRNTGYPLYATFNTPAFTATTGSTDSMYKHLRGGGMYAIPQKILGAGAGTVTELTTNAAT